MVLSRTRPLLALATLLAGVFGAFLVLAGPAAAHATVVSSDPSDGQRLQRVPSRVTVTFDEAVGLGSLTYLNVIDTRGDRVDTGPVTHSSGNPKQIGVALKPGLPDGTYTESYRVISADSHPVAGVIRFVVGTGALVDTTVSSGTADSDVAALFDIARWISYVGVALLGGTWLLMTVFLGGREDNRARGVVWLGWTAAMVGGLAELVLQGPYVAGRPLGDALDSAVIDATLHTSFGTLHSIRFALLGAIGLILGLALQPNRRPLAIDHLFWPLGIAVAYTFSAEGHAATTNPTWLSIALDMAHILAMATWVGGLVILVTAVLPRRDPVEYAETLPVFSRTAFTCVVVIAVTGTYAAWRGVGSWRALVDTEYGLLVLGKVALLLALMALGNLSRVMIQRRVRRPVVAFAITDAALDEAVDEPEPPPMDDLHIERMRRSVLVEIVLALGVLGLTALLVTQPRGAEALAGQVPSQVTATAPLAQHASALVTVRPGEHGRIAITVRLQGETAKSVQATATQQAAQVGPLPIKLRRTGSTTWTATNVNLPVSGSWTITLVVGASEFEAVTTDATVDLK